MKRVFRQITALCIGAILATGAPGRSLSNAPTGPVEQKYFANGPFKVDFVTTDEPCDRKGDKCDIWFPVEGGPRRPVVLWANGTLDSPVSPEIYGYWLRHMASWGFVVAATKDGKTGYGDTVRDTLAYLRGKDADPKSAFYRRLDFSRVGVAGHSQGAAGAANAMIQSNGAIRTAISFHLPRQIFCSPPDNCLLTPTLTGARSGSIFYVSGTLDTIISPDRQLGATGLNSLTAYYDATPASLVKAKGLLIGPTHSDIAGTPACGIRVVAGCFLGTYGYLGFPTAWMMWQLQNAPDAAAAFREGGEFFAAKAWTGQRSNAR